jgi:hypothetical protein
MLFHGGDDIKKKTRTSHHSPYPSREDGDPKIAANNQVANSAADKAKIPVPGSEQWAVLTVW